MPILVATQANNLRVDLVWSPDGVAKPLLSNANNLSGAIHRAFPNAPKQERIDAERWAVSGYKPTPTIIEAAQALYLGHRVEDITPLRCRRKESQGNDELS